MTITVLIENLVYRKDLVAEHGLSIHIDTGREKILFDTGQTGDFADNGRKMGIDISDVDYLVISHGHYDHTGGMNRFFADNSKAKVLISRRALNPKHKNDVYVGIPYDLELPDERIQFIKTSHALSENTHILCDILTDNENDTHFCDFYKDHNSAIVPDNFNDEIILCLESKEGMHIITGCSHNGISNIHATAKRHFSKPVISLIGGFHLVNIDEIQVKELAEYFNNEHVKRIYTGHCTGIDNYCLLKKYSVSDIEYLHTAMTINLG